MKSIKGTKTEENLLKSFAGESQAHMRYKLYAKMAKEEGYKEAEEFFKEASKEEKHHATTWYKLLNNGSIPTTKENIEYQIQKENDEWTDVEGSYEYMAKIAREEGFEDIANYFDKIAQEEESHEKHLTELLSKLEKSKVGGFEKCCYSHCDCEEADDDCDCEDCDCEDCEDCDCEDCDCEESDENCKCKDCHCGK